MEFIVGLLVGVIFTSTMIYIFKKIDKFEEYMNNLEEENDNKDELITSLNNRINQLQNIIDNK